MEKEQEEWQSKTIDILSKYWDPKEKKITHVKDIINKKYFSLY